MQPRTVQPPKFSTRAAAFHVDALLFSVVYEAMHIFTLKFFPAGVPGLILFIIFLVATFVVFVGPTKSTGQTLGKKLYGLKVFKADAGPAREAVPLTWTQVVVRELVIKTISSTLLGLGFWQARRDPEGKAWHDQFCKTVVRSLRDEGSNRLSVKLLESATSLLTVVVGLVLTVLAFAYTSLPLGFFQEKLSEAGIQTEGLSGSIAGGLQVSKVTASGVSLQDFEIALSLWPSWQTKRIVLDHVRLRAGTVETDTPWSWSELANSLVFNLVQHSLGNADYDPESELGLQTETPALKLVVRELGVTDLKIGTKSAVGTDSGGLRLLELQLRNINLDNGALSVATALFRAPGVSLKSDDLQYSEGVLQMTSVKGQLTEALIPTLKKPFDFEVHGDLALDQAQQKLEKIQGSFLGAVGNFTLEDTRLSIKAEAIPLWDLFRTRLPLKTLSLRVNALSEPKTANLAETIFASAANYDLDFCGRHDVAVMPKPAPDTLSVLANEKDAVDNAFLFRSQNGVITPENVDAFCGITGTGGAVVRNSEVRSSEDSGTAASAPADERWRLANSLFRAGKFGEAMNAINQAPLPAASASPAEVGAFYSLKGWIYLYANDPTAAAADFERAYKARADLSDIEGLIRAEEKKSAPDPKKINEWLSFAKRAVKSTPSAASRLTPRFRERLGR